MKNDLVDALFIVAVFSFTTMAVSTLFKNTPSQIVIYAILFIYTAWDKKNRRK